MAQKRLKLWIVTRQFYPVLGGASERFRRYAPGLKSRGIDIEIYTCNDSNLKEYELIDGIPVYRKKVDDLNQGFNKLLKSLKNEISAKKKPHVMLFFSSYPSNFFDMLFFRLMGIKLVFVSTMVSEYNFKSKIKNLKIFFYSNLILLPMNKIIVSSYVMKNSFSKNIKNIDVIPNGVNINKFRPFNSYDEKTRIKLSMGFNKNDILVVFVGFFSHRKGVDLLIDSWIKVKENHPHSKLLIVGPYKPTKLSRNYDSSWFDSKFYHKVKRVIKNNNLENDIVFYGKVENVEKYLKISDIFILPSRQEGMGNVVFEAMATGLACILTPFIGLPEEFGIPSEEYILTEHDKNKIADSIIMLINDEELRKKIKNRGRDNIKRFELEKVLDMYSLTLKKLINVN